MELDEQEVGLVSALVIEKGCLSLEMAKLMDGKAVSYSVPKTGGRLFVTLTGEPLEVPLFTHTLHRDAYEAWQKAHDLQIPVAPILGTRQLNQKPVMSKEEFKKLPESLKSQIIVDTRFLGIASNRLSSETRFCLKGELAKQVKAIREGLESNEITYTPRDLKMHDRDMNYMVELIDRQYFVEQGGWSSINTMPYSPELFSTNFDEIVVKKDQDGEFIPFDNEDPTQPFVVVYRLMDWDHAFVGPDYTPEPMPQEWGLGFA
jgi:hypothetical protein